ncbi:MAG: 16S rRNA (cytidine(1402)-2'-O)-methyltransferase [Gammaproteobacteria bacterium TMED226]|nr:MAG: 16S rRNA (cytidine(1402)-2'-O)-methyltransferase [Gammaproteobacteria bacterium TMED226]|tara:strand:+ start:634 stop:1449 length:816 start_codon:yes stop_codon:yes gene_type:complete
MLYFISTPIGNLNDISLRAIDVIRSSDYLYAEDTRTTKKLLDFIDCNKKCKSFHEHNEDRTSIEIIKYIKDNKTVSIVSDAGTPAVSDPGYKLIRECSKESINYTLIPGPSSVLSALVMSGLPTDKFSFYGFMPRKKSEQQLCFENLKNENKTAIFFESSNRVKKTISHMLRFLDPTRNISICKEMTKLHEQILRGNLVDILEDIKNEKILLKGEIVIVIEGSKKYMKSIALDIKTKKEFLKKMSASDAAKLISLVTGENKRDIYKYLIET